MDSHTASDIRLTNIAIHPLRFPAPNPSCPTRTHPSCFAPLLVLCAPMSDYEGTRVQELNVDTLKFQHRMSYGHRNRKTVVVVVYDPTHPACKAVEYEVGGGEKREE